MYSILFVLPSVRARMLIADAVSESSGAGTSRGGSEAEVGVAVGCGPLSRQDPSFMSFARASAGKKSGIESSRMKFTRCFAFFGSYSTRTRVPLGSSASNSLSFVSTADAHRRASLGVHEFACLTTYPGNLSVSNICVFTTRP